VFLHRVHPITVHRSSTLLLESCERQVRIWCRAHGSIIDGTDCEQPFTPPFTVTEWKRWRKHESLQQYTGLLTSEENRQGQVYFPKGLSTDVIDHRGEAGQVE
jgi:hypothetical protein